MIEKSVPRIADWHQKACRVMTNGDPRDTFLYPTLTRKMGSVLAHHCYLLINYLFILK